MKKNFRKKRKFSREDFLKAKQIRLDLDNEVYDSSYHQYFHDKISEFVAILRQYKTKELENWCREIEIAQQKLDFPSQDKQKITKYLGLSIAVEHMRSSLTYISSHYYSSFNPSEGDLKG